jgi:hypothetical protein
LIEKNEKPLIGIFSMYVLQHNTYQQEKPLIGIFSMYVLQHNTYQQGLLAGLYFQLLHLSDQCSDLQDTCLEGLTNKTLC